MLADDPLATLATVMNDMPAMMIEALQGRPKLRTVTLLGEAPDGQTVQRGFVIVVAPLEAGPTLDEAMTGFFGPCISRNVTLVEEPDAPPTQEPQ